MNIKVIDESITRKLSIEYYINNLTVVCDIWINYKDGEFNSAQVDFNYFKYKNRKIYNDTFWDFYEVEENTNDIKELRDHLINEIIEFIKFNYPIITDLNMLYNVKR